MKGLLIDTTSKNSYIIAFNNSNIQTIMLDENKSTMSSILPAIDIALKKVLLEISEIEVVASVVGPGSFTGIRIGVTIANAIAYAINVPRFSFTSFDIMRLSANEGDLLCIDAGHDSFYSSRVVQLGVDDFKCVDACDIIAEKCVYYTDIISQIPSNASKLFFSVAESYLSDRCDQHFKVDYLKPFYMKKSQAERTLEIRKKI